MKRKRNYIETSFTIYLQEENRVHSEAKFKILHLESKEKNLCLLEIKICLKKHLNNMKIEYVLIPSLFQV